MEIKNRKVARFRTHIDPMIGPKPRNAFDMKEHCFEAELTPVGIYVKLTNPGRPGDKAQEEEHIVPFANVQSIKLLPLPKEDK